MPRVRVSTRAVSAEQEKRVKKLLKGRLTFNSGAGAFDKGDVYTEQLMVECKTKLKESDKVTVYKVWLDDLIRASVLSCRTPLLWLDNGKANFSYIVIPYSLFTRLTIPFHTTEKLATHLITRVYWELSEIQFLADTASRFNLDWAIMFTFGTSKAFVLLDAKHIDAVREAVENVSKPIQADKTK